MDGGEAKDKKLGRTPDIFVRNCLTDVKHLQYDPATTPTSMKLQFCRHRFCLRCIFRCIRRRLSELTPATDKVERAFLIVVLALIFLGTRKLSEGMESDSISF